VARLPPCRPRRRQGLRDPRTARWTPIDQIQGLIDLVAIAQRTEIAADSQRRALRKEAERRMLELPLSFEVPDRDLWTRGYRAEARRTVGLSALELDAALAVAKPFLDPVLAGFATGIWSPGRREWVATA
jgi:hypothetical protein